MVSQSIRATLVTIFMTCIILRFKRVVYDKDIISITTKDEFEGR